MSGYTIIDADTHVTESPDLWTSRAPASMRDRVPYVVMGDDGSQRWVLGGTRSSPLASVGMTATAGRGSFNNPPRGKSKVTIVRRRGSSRILVAPASFEISPAHAPAALTIHRVRSVPASVLTPRHRPRSASIARTSHPVRTLTPRRRA
jgi:hypothetical protein